MCEHPLRGAAGTCGAAPSGTTLSGASYTATYACDTLNRLTTGPAGSYTYGDSAHLHALTATSNGHGYAYDASGNATCRTASTTTPCSGTPAGAALSYDAEGRLAAWQNTPSAPTTTDAFLYDGAGSRVEQQVTTSGSTTTSVYVGALAEYTLKGSTTWRKYYPFAGQLVADNDGVWNYLLSNQQGTAEAQVGATGVGEEGSLRTPYGSTRYGTSEFMGDLGFTGQRKDSTPDLVYYGARYYDQDTGVFMSADTTLAGGLNRYAYVMENPESLVDPTGQMPEWPPNLAWWWTVVNLVVGVVDGLAPATDVPPITPPPGQTAIMRQAPAVEETSPTLAELVQDGAKAWRNASQGDITIPGYGSTPPSDRPGGPTPPTPEGSDDDTPPTGPGGGGARFDRDLGRSPRQEPGTINGSQIPAPRYHPRGNYWKLIEVNTLGQLTTYTGQMARRLEINGYNQYGFDMQGNSASSVSPATSERHAPSYGYPYGGWDPGPGMAPAMEEDAPEEIPGAIDILLGLLCLA